MVLLLYHLHIKSNNKSPFESKLISNRTISNTFKSKRMLIFIQGDFSKDEFPLDFEMAVVYKNNTI